MRLSFLLGKRQGVLSQKQREFYFENGYLLLEKIVPDDLLAELRSVAKAMVEQSRSVTRSDSVWDVDEGHSMRQSALKRPPRWGNRRRRSAGRDWPD